jgi:hypothetical protein
LKKGLGNSPDPRAIVAHGFKAPLSWDLIHDHLSHLFRCYATRQIDHPDAQIGLLKVEAAGKSWGARHLYIYGLLAGTEGSTRKLNKRETHISLDR